MAFFFILNILFNCLSNITYLPISSKEPSAQFLHSLLIWGCSPTLTNTQSSFPSIHLYTGHQAFLGTRASAPIDAWLIYLLLLRILEQWVSQFVNFGWKFNPRDLCVGGIFYIVVLPMGCKLFNSLVYGFKKVMASSNAYKTGMWFLLSWVY